MTAVHPIDRLMEQAIARGVFPGAVLRVHRNGHEQWHCAYGMADLFSRRPVTCGTLFDLASLTKPLATSLAVMALVRDGRLSLVDSPASWLDGWQREGHAKLTVRHLLTHCSGLPAWRPYFRQLAGLPADGRRVVLETLLAAEPLLAPPGKTVLYSDLGYLVLQQIVESTANVSLDHYFQAAVCAPLDLDELFFRPLDATVQVNDVAATELCPWRHRLLVGQVHDDNAYVLNGVAGHAGLFGTARAVSRLLDALLAAYHGHAGPAFDHHLMRAWLTRQPEIQWALGFDTPSDQGSSAGRYFARASIGHLGFTGTSFWLDLEKKIHIVLLTNRVHPCRFNAKIRAFRPLLHDTIMQTLFGQRRA